jgi:hypothetical protein
MRYGVVVAWLLGLALLAAPPAPAQGPDWPEWSHKDSGFSIRRPADLYELDPESERPDVTAEVEWGPKDHGWAVTVTTETIKDGKTAQAAAAARAKEAEVSSIEETTIGDGIKAQRVWLRDDDSFGIAIFFPDKAGKTLIGVALEVPLEEKQVRAGIADLRRANAATIALFERILATARLR